MEDKDTILGEQIATDQTNEAQNLLEQPKRRESTSLLKGIVGAVVGGIAGVVLWVVIAILIEGTFGLVGGFIVCSLVYFGYKLFGGKREKPLIITLCIATAVFTFIGVTGYILVTEYQYAVAYNESYVYSIMGTNIPFTEILAMSEETMFGYITSSFGEFFSAVTASYFTYSLTTIIYSYTTAIIALFVYSLRERHLSTYMHVRIKTDTGDEIDQLEHELQNDEMVEGELKETVVHAKDSDIKIAEAHVSQNDIATNEEKKNPPSF